MSKRSGALVVALALAIGLLTATPAAATYGASISFPGNTTTFYSPFSGPANITFTFNDDGEPGTNDKSEMFSLRLRVENGATVHTDSVTIYPDSQSSPKTVQFSWPALTVKQTTRYVVAIYKDGAQYRQRTFTMKPRLVRIVSINPDPFFPRIKDGYRDTTNVTYRLAASSQPVIVRIYQSNAEGQCCSGSMVRHQNLHDESVGTRHYIWNGRGDGGGRLPKGDYWVQITATDYGGVTRTSKPAEVSIALYHRVFKRVGRHGIKFHHTGPEKDFRSGGDCWVRRDFLTRDLWITCKNSAFSVFWRWAIPTSGQIEAVSFALIGVPGYVCGATKGHTTTDSFLRVGGLGQHRCRVDKARITYSYLKAS